MDLSALYGKMVVIFFTIVLGFLAGRTKLLDTGNAGRITKLVLYMTNPCLVLASVLGTERMLRNTQVLALTGVAAGTYVFLILSSLLLWRVLRIPKQDLRQRGVYEFLYLFANVAFMGYPVVSALFGPGAIFYATIFSTPFNLLCYTYGAYIISGRNAKGTVSLKKLLQPMVLSALAAYVLYFLDVRAPALLTECLSEVGNLTTPLALIVLGVNLSQIPLRAAFGNVRLYALAVIRLIAAPLLAYLAVSPLFDDLIIRGVTVVTMAMPSAISATMLSMENGGDTETASAGVFLTTLLSVGTIPLMMRLLFGR